MGIVVYYLGGVIKHQFTSVTETNGFNLVVSVILVIRVKVDQWFQKETYLNRSGVDQRMEQTKELSNKFKNFRSLHSLGRTKARPF